METKVNFNVMETIETIYQSSKDSKLQPAFFEVVEKEINLLSDYLELNKFEVVLFANAFVNWFENNNFSFVFEHFGLSKFQVLKFRESIDTLYSRNLLMNINHHKKQITSYDISQNIINAISKNEFVKNALIDTQFERKSFVDMLEEFDIMSDQFDGKLITHFDFKDYISTLCQENLDMPFFREINNYKLSDFETYFFLDTIWDAINSGDNNFNTYIQNTVNGYYKQKSKSLYYFKKIMDKETKLSKLNLIEVSKDGFLNKSCAKLSNKVIDFLSKNENLKLEDTAIENSKLIMAKDIMVKKLFYNPSEQTQLTQISTILSNNKFKEMQKRLKEKCMPIGITAILHGVPGTGKTESVYQLAKETGRNIFKVDISETKSMWYGESQKLVKNIFTEYATLKKTEALCPILLFNEADAIIGKRKTSGSNQVSNTENAIQNIILEEMEKFDGIFFATTNLVENMDAAFERRFLFKVKFEEPSLENASKIWQEKLPMLTPSESKTLARQFKFSGGEMENIARKYEMEAILNAKNLSFLDIENLCKLEKWTETQEIKKIGFNH